MITNVYAQRSDLLLMRTARPPIPDIDILLLNLALAMFF